MDKIFTISSHYQLLNMLLKSSLLNLTIICASLFSFSSFADIANKKDLKGTVHQRVLIVVSSDRHGYWLPEVVEPYQLLQQAGFAIDIASPLGGEGKASGVFRLSAEQKNWLKHSELTKKLSNSKKIKQVDARNYQAVYFAGGSGPMFDFINNLAIQKLTASIYQNGGIVSADCHGIAALLNVKLATGSRLIAGKNITAKANHEEGHWARKNYPFLLEDKISQLGGNYQSAPKGKAHVVVDDRLITGQNPASAIPMTKQLINALLQL